MSEERGREKRRGNEHHQNLRREKREGNVSFSLAEANEDVGLREIAYPSLEPVGPGVAERRVDDEDREEQNDRFERVEKHRQRLVHDPGEDDHERDNEKGDLNARSHGDTHREV